MNIRRILSAVFSGMVVAVVAPAALAGATGTVVVTPANTQGWYEADVRAGGEINYVSDATSPYPDGALQLKTDANTASKAQYLKNVNVQLDDVSELSYYTKQVSGPAEAAASYQVVTDLNGSAAGGFATLVYEPYWNGAVLPGVWQQWDVDAGRFWSSATVTCSGGTVTRMPGGPATYTLEQLQTMCPDAVVGAFGVNVGTFNLNYNVLVDGVNFNGTTYNFEQRNEPNAKDECKKDGYKNYTDNEGRAFKNQGACVSYAARAQN